MIVAGAGTSKEFNTGEWSEVKPEFIADKCKQCLLMCTGLSGQLHPGKRHEDDWSI